MIVVVKFNMKLTTRIVLGFLIAIIVYVVSVLTDSPSFISIFASILMFFLVLILTSKSFHEKMEEDRIIKKELREKERLRDEELREIEAEEYTRERGRLKAQEDHEESHKQKNYLEGLGSSPAIYEMMGKKRNKNGSRPYKII